jgi:CubicO group peptidase (beta-lactamase class C family)
MERILMIWCVVVVLTTGHLSAQKDYKDSLNLLLDQAFVKAKLPGFAAIIVDRNRIVYQRSGGYANIEKHLPFTTQTIENIGSVSKTFIAVALMKAIELGYFSLETNINDILPFRVVNPYCPDCTITIRQLTTHTSGIIDNDSIYHKSYKFIINDTSDKEAISALAERGYSGGLMDTTLELFLENYLSADGRLYSKNNFYNSKPGQRSSYSNIASALAAFLIQTKAGISFAAFTKKYLLQPLHMNSSGWWLDSVNMKQHAIPYLTVDVPLPFYSLTTYPDGGLISSAEDLSRYAIEMIKSLNGHSHLLRKKLVKRMFSPAFGPDGLPQNFNPSKRTKGVFWNLYTDGFIGHDGDDPGVSTNLLFNEKFGIIFISNMYLEDRSEFVELLKKYGGKMLQD